MSYNIIELQKFSNLYFSHNYFHELGIENSYLRVVAAASGPLKQRYPDKFKDKWFLEQKVITAQDLLNCHENNEDIKWLIERSKKGCNLYYYPNITHKDMRGVATDKQIIAYLYWCLDYDYVLGVGIDKLCTDSGLDVCGIICTSRYKHKQNYQVLIRSSVEQCRDVAECQRVGKWLAGVWVSDAAVMNPATLLRLPGFMNWKIAVDSKTNMAGVAHIVQENIESKHYSHQELSAIENKYRDILCENSGRTGQATLAPATAYAEILNAEYTKSYHITHKQALAALPEKLVGKGERHRALISWAGELAKEVSNLGDSAERETNKQLARALLCRLGTECCSPTADISDIRKADRWFLDVLSRDLNKQDKHMQQLLGVDEDNKDNKNEVVKAGAMDGDLEIEETNVELALADNNSHSKKSRKQLGIIDIIQLWVDEFCQDLDINWLTQFVINNHACQRADGMHYDISRSILERLDTLGFLPGPNICHLSSAVAPWEEKYSYLNICNKDQTYTLISALIENICKLVVKNSKKISKHQAFNKLRTEISHRICVELDVEVGSDKWAKRMEKEINLALDIKLSSHHKKNIVAECVRAVSAFKLEEDINHLQGKIAFQNGILDVATGDFKNCDGYRFSTRVLCSNYTATNITSLDIPLFMQFLSDCFPNDPETWELVLVIIGYMCITDNPLQKIFAFSGISGSGKSCLAKIIAGIVGKHNVAVSHPDVMGKEAEGISQCVDKLMCLVEEAESGNQNVHQTMFTRLKEITNGYDVRVRNLYNSAYQTKIHSKFVLVSNLVLKYEDTLGASARRMVPLDFNNPVMDGKAIAYLDEKILAAEGPKITIAAAQTLMKHWHKGQLLFSEWDSKALTDGREELATETDPLGHVLSEILEIGEDYQIPVPIMKVLCSHIAPNYNDNAMWLKKNVYSYLKRKGISDDNYGKNARIYIDRKQISLVKGCRINVSKLVEITKVNFSEIICAACDEVPDLKKYMTATAPQLLCCQITKKEWNSILQLITKN